MVRPQKNKKKKKPPKFIITITTRFSTSQLSKFVFSYFYYLYKRKYLFFDFYASYLTLTYFNYPKLSFYSYYLVFNLYYSSNKEGREVFFLNSNSSYNYEHIEVLKCVAS